MAYVFALLFLHYAVQFQFVTHSTFFLAPPRYSLSFIHFSSPSSSFLFLYNPIQETPQLKTQPPFIPAKPQTRTHPPHAHQPYIPATWLVHSSPSPSPDASNPTSRSSLPSPLDRMDAGHRPDHGWCILALRSSRRGDRRTML